MCGGGDPGEGYGNTAVPITASAAAAIKAVILMGDPRNIAGLPYNVGTCKAGGVSICRAVSLTTFLILLLFSLMPTMLASSAPLRPRSSHTVMPQTLTAATATTPTLTRATAQSTARWPSLLSTASSPAVAAVARRRRRPQALPAPEALPPQLRLNTDSAAVSATLALLFVLAASLARS